MTLIKSMRNYFMVHNMESHLYNSSCDLGMRFRHVSWLLLWSNYIVALIILKQHLTVWVAMQSTGKPIENVYYMLLRGPLYPVKHDGVIKWKHFPFVWGINRSAVNSPHNGQWRPALMFSLICAWINAWVNNREAGDLRRPRAHYNIIVMNIHALALFLKMSLGSTSYHNLVSDASVGTINTFVMYK